MDVSELHKFSIWIDKHIKLFLPEYQALSNVLQHNVEQSPKQPVEQPLEELKQVLSEIPMEQLGSQELDFLGRAEIDMLLGDRGAETIDRYVKNAEYDPATSATKVQEGLNRLNQTIKNMEQIRTALEQYPFMLQVEEGVDGRWTLRVIFKDQAAISDVKELKRWSAEWHDIVRGIALCVDEAPEHTKVVAAGTGSIIVVLAGTAVFVSLIALITKKLASIVKEGLEIGHAMEDLRHKRFMNRTIESELKKKQKELASQGVDSILDEVRSALQTNLNGEQLAALKKSIQKFLKFSELGGELDFVSPESSSDDDEETDGPDASQIASHRELIREIRDERLEIKRLENHNSDTD